MAEGQGNTELFTVAQVITALEMSGGINLGAAQKLNCAPNTIAGYIKRHPEIADAVAQIVENNLDLSETQLIKAIADGSERSVHFYLRTKGKHRGYTEGREISGPGGKPLQTQPVAPIGLDLSKFSTDELEQFEALCAKAAVEADDGAA